MSREDDAAPLAARGPPCAAAVSLERIRNMRVPSPVARTARAPEAVPAEPRHDRSALLDAGQGGSSATTTHTCQYQTFPAGAATTDGSWEDLGRRLVERIRTVRRIGRTMVQSYAGPDKVSTPTRRSRQKWNAGTASALLVALVLVLIARSHMLSGRGTRDVRRDPNWRWDHNTYDRTSSITERNQRNHSLETQPIMQDSPDDTANAGNVLILQTAESSSLDELIDITSRVNRAYAHHFRFDYARVSWQASDTRTACSAKALALYNIAVRPGVLQTHNSSASQSAPPQFAAPVRYHSVLLLPADAMLLDMDWDVRHILPPDSLVAVAGWETVRGLEDPSSDGNATPEPVVRSDPAGPTGTLMFNIRHKLAAHVATAWWSRTEESPFTCRSGSDMEHLIQAMEAVAAANGESLASLVHRLNETNSGFLCSADGERIIKELIPRTPTCQTTVMAAATLQQSKVTLQTAADSVCYRYYPRCELL